MKNIKKERKKKLEYVLKCFLKDAKLCETKIVVSQIE